MLLKFTYYAQEQGLLSDYCAFYMQFCMRNSLHVADNFIKTVLLGCINERYQSIPLEIRHDLRPEFRGVEFVQ